MKIIAKYYPVGWYCNASQDNPIHDFLVVHSAKCWEKHVPKKSNIDTGSGTNMFGFRTENDKDEFQSDYRKEPYKLINVKKCPNTPRSGSSKAPKKKSTKPKKN